MASLITPACPGCGSTPVGGPRSWTCPGCGSRYRGLRGIIDLRVGEDEFLPNREDWEYAERLDEDFDRLDFRGLLDRYFDLSPEIPARLRERQVAHILTAPDRVRTWLDALGPAADSGPLLDLGCGSGSFLAAVAPSERPVAGVDIALRWLIVARKRLDEEGLGHVPLACGCAERLPFADRSFAGVVAGDVIEHVGDQAATLDEAHRVLQAGGQTLSRGSESVQPRPRAARPGLGRRVPASAVDGRLRSPDVRPRLPGDPDAGPGRMERSPRTEFIPAILDRGPGAAGRRPRPVRPAQASGGAGLQPTGGDPGRPGPGEEDRAAVPRRLRAGHGWGGPRLQPSHSPSDQAARRASVIGRARANRPR